MSRWSAEHSQPFLGDFPAFPCNFPCFSWNDGFSPERDSTAVKSWILCRVTGNFPRRQELSEVIGLKSLEKVSGRGRRSFFHGKIGSAAAPPRRNSNSGPSGEFSFEQNTGILEYEGFLPKSRLLENCAQVIPQDSHFFS